MIELFDELDEEIDLVIVDIDIEGDEIFDIEYYGSEEAKIEREIDEMEALNDLYSR